VVSYEDSYWGLLPKYLNCTVLGGTDEVVANGIDLLHRAIPRVECGAEWGTCPDHGADQGAHGRGLAIDCERSHGRRREEIGRLLFRGFKRPPLPIFLVSALTRVASLALRADVCALCVPSALTEQTARSETHRLRGIHATYR
jgi:hypothetical protein